MIWFRRMGLRVPEDLAVACLASVQGEPSAAVVEDSELLGATLVDLVAGKIFCNEFGPRPPQGHPHRGPLDRGQNRARRAPSTPAAPSSSRPAVPGSGTA